jgi:hypothetical protein
MRNQRRPRRHTSKGWMPISEATKWPSSLIAYASLCKLHKSSKMAFMSSANDTFSDLVETLDRGWTMIEELSQRLHLAARAASESRDQDGHS